MELKLKVNTKGRSFHSESSKKTSFLSLLIGGLVAGLLFAPLQMAWSHYESQGGYYTIGGCPSGTSVTEGDSIEFRVHIWETEKLVGNNYDIAFSGWDATIQTQPGTANSGDYTHTDEKKWMSGYNGNTSLKFNIDTIDDDAWEGDENFTIDVTQVRMKQTQDRTWPASDRVDRHHIPPLNEGHTSCTVTIKDNDLKIVGINIPSSPENGIAYGVDEVIKFDVSFNDVVEKSGHIFLHFFVGGPSPWRGATYKRGNNSSTLHFEYTVKAGDNDDNGISVGGAHLEIIGLGSDARIWHEEEDTDAKRTFSGSMVWKNLSDHKVDTSTE